MSVTTTTSLDNAPDKAAEPAASLADVKQYLKDKAAKLIVEDPAVRERIRIEVVNEDEVAARIDAVLTDNLVDEFAPRHAELRAAEAHRAQEFSKTLPWYEIFLITLLTLSLFVLLGLGIAKWLGHLLFLPIWPFVVAPIVLSIANFIVNDSGDVAQFSLAAEALERVIREQIRLKVVEPAINLATSIQFAPLPQDIVRITDARGLSSHVESDRRIETASYRSVLTSLRRDGGATIGLSGSRGAGKSELLKSFCGNTATIKEGGPIGIVVAAPVAYDAEPFLRLLIRRLAEAVPEYRDRLHSNKRTLDFVIPASGALVMLAGALVIAGVPVITRHSIGVALIILGGIILSASPALRRFLPIFTIFFSNSNNESIFSFSYAQMKIEIATPGVLPNIWPLSLLFTTKDEKDRASRSNREVRRKLAGVAWQSARKIQYVENRSMSVEGSASWKSMGIKRTSSLGLNQVPLSEPDLVFELSCLVSALHSGGYEVRIGIDELDKLASTEDAEKFLTSIKNLFPIRDCSFLLTISEDAAAQFARRGMPIRDVFDSSLDALIIVQPLSFQEARRLARTRLLHESRGKMTDSQILACHCLAGGLPREFLRVCRQLGEINAGLGGESKLDAVFDILMKRELRSLIDGTRTALRGRDDHEVSMRFYAELDCIEDEIGQKQLSKGIVRFLSSDSGFTKLCRDASMTDEPGGADSAADTNRNWIQDERRRLYACLYFAQTVRFAFESSEPLVWNDANRSDEIIKIFELLAQARRWLELDPAAAWRRTTNVRAKFGLTSVVVDADQPLAAAGSPAGPPKPPLDGA